MRWFLRLLLWPLRAIANAPKTEAEMARWESEFLLRHDAERHQ